MLLGLLSRLAGDEVTMSGTALRPAPQAGTPPRDAGPSAGTYVLTLTGTGLSHEAVSGFALALEATGLFERVTLLETLRSRIGRFDAVGFRLECAIAGAEEGNP
jgi:hypothetical protein